MAALDKRWPAAFIETATARPETYVRIRVKSSEIAFHCPTRLCRYRAETILTKEPETIEWINSFGRGEVLWDIGANIGVYSLYAAIVRGAKVLAFEPSPFNTAMLVKNVSINRADEMVWTFPIALSDRTRADYLMMQNIDAGGALSSFGTDIDLRGEKFIPTHRNMTLGYSIDDFVSVFGMPRPNHIKIDVDGTEMQVTAGMARTLSHPDLKSVAIELDDARAEETAAIAERIEACGFQRVWKRQGPRRAGSPFVTSFNWLFRRS